MAALKPRRLLTFAQLNSLKGSTTRAKTFASALSAALFLDQSDSVRTGSHGTRTKLMSGSLPCPALRTMARPAHEDRSTGRRCPDAPSVSEDLLFVMWSYR
jgi:hypothetical protein